MMFYFIFFLEDGGGWWPHPSLRGFLVGKGSKRFLAAVNAALPQRVFKRGLHASSVASTCMASRLRKGCFSNPSRQL